MTSQLDQMNWELHIRYQLLTFDVFVFVSMQFLFALLLPGSFATYDTY
jgi:hypothetical protein